MNSMANNETRLEFYLNNNLLMEGTLSEFIKLGLINRQSLELGLGDRFPIEDFPTDGQRQIVRVIEIQRQEKFEDKPDTIKYFLEPYKE